MRCFDASGVPANSLFTAHFTNRTAAAGTFAYFWANDATPLSEWAARNGVHYQTAWTWG